VFGEAWYNTAKKSKCKSVAKTILDLNARFFHFFTICLSKTKLIPLNVFPHLLKRDNLKGA
jgi:hypothetical protein